MLPILSSTARHAIGLMLGGFVADGIMTGEQAEIITNAAIAVGGIAPLVAWSWIEKRFLTKKP